MGYYFNLPPFTKLTSNQRLALEEENAIALSGGPGTGKTVVSLWRHIRNYELEQKNSLLLTYTKTLENYLRITAERQNKDAAANINRTFWWTTHKAAGTMFDEIIVDEAQDVKIEKYITINAHAKQVCYGADKAQSVYLKKKEVEDLLKELKRLFPDNEEYELTKNYRNSNEILLFTKSVFPKKAISIDEIESASSTGIKPMVSVLGWDNFEEAAIKIIIEIVHQYPDETHNIGILVPTVSMVNNYYGSLTNSITCSMFVNEMDEFDTLKRVHVTTFKSAKGLEFNTVIIPNFDNYKWFIAHLDNFSESDYYVALTRAKRNLFLLCKNELDIIDDTFTTL